ncbi:MAG: T9SS type A sorting domain-containing protein [Paludibacteraceae bacterium]|nr:T9SS type A sorting domain-containing protein [Paludibacteraceae bacterium]
MIKKFFSAVALFSCMLSVDAAVSYMTVEQKSGEKFSFLLKDNPIVTYKDGDLVVNGDPVTSYAISGVLNYHFTESNESGVKNLNANVLRIVSLDDNAIGVENAAAGAKVSLTNLSGAVLSTTTTDPSGAAIVTLPNTKGVYVLSVGKQSFKVIRK